MGAAKHSVHYNTVHLYRRILGAAGGRLAGWARAKGEKFEDFSQQNNNEHNIKRPLPSLVVDYVMNYVDHDILYVVVTNANAG